MRESLEIHTSSKSSEWETPKDFFEKYNNKFNFDIDVCATHENHLCDKYWTKEEDALKQDWGDMACWMNPPYGREIKEFMKKAYEASLNGATVVCLVPSRTDTDWFHRYAMNGEIEFVRGRLKFINRTFPSWRADGNFKISPACFPSAVVIFKPLLQRPWKYEGKSEHDQCGWQLN
jgi:phage N-6-adenine-methyltransferase